MSRVCFVTSITSREPVQWGLEVHRIAVPFVLLCTPEMADALRPRAPSQVIIVTTEIPDPLTPDDKLAQLQQISHANFHDAERYYWLDIGLIYQHLSFEFLYSDVLVRAVNRFSEGPAYFAMPGYHPSSFFGGPTPALAAAHAQRDGAAQNLFEPVVIPEIREPFFRPASDHHDDLNLQLASVIDEPILHIVGDSHVLNCFTLNAAIGCRTNILVNAREVSDITVPYAYHFTHHLGGRTMHHAGRPRTLLAAARQCGVKDGDAVVWVFGEIDVRSHIIKQREECHRDVAEIIDTLASDYIRSIGEVTSHYAGLRTVVFAPIPPLDNPGYTSDTLPVYGSIQERIAATRQLRDRLESLCRRQEILFLDVAASFATERGDLRWELSDHFCHIASTYQRPIIDALYTLLAGGRGGTAAGGA